ncbi:MAG: hypothetical protein RLY86_1544 [Pseudomonadota bacterium]|jgi:uncharacterized protein (TIGR02444 family)
MDPTAAEPPGLWDWSLSVYGQPGVAAACLGAQDRHGADVNLLLWAAWAGAVHGHRLTAGEVQTARAAVAAWHRDVVLPLRAVRRRLKHGPAPAPDSATEPLRARVKAAELEAERLEQAVLAAHPATLRRGVPGTDAMAANLRHMIPPVALGPLLHALTSAHPGVNPSG